MSTEYGIFSDESPDHTSESAVESQFYSREEAETRLAEIRAKDGAEQDESGEWDDNCYVHECEEPDDEEDENEDAEEGADEEASEEDE